MRTFIAIAIPINRELESAMHELSMMRPKLKMVTPNQLHVTLAFLGETNESLLPKLKQIIEDVAATMNAEQLTLHGIGVFPGISHPTVVWTSFADSRPLKILAEMLSHRCDALGFARETRPYHPHLTLARIKSQPPHGLARFVHDHAHANFGTETMTEVELFRSDLERDGPVYTPLHKASLQLMG